MAKGERLPGGAAGRSIWLNFEGERIPAREGEPVSVSLLAAGVDVFSRAVKYHRARGPFCLSGRCSHCVMRVDGEPNVATCITPAKDGLRIERQNAFPGVDYDVFRTIDWMYPKGLDHHTLFAGVPVVERIVAKVARQMAGLGQLPDAARADGARYLEHQTDVVVVGGGCSGLAAAQAAAAAGAQVTVIDEQPQPGGRLRTGLFGAPSPALATLLATGPATPSPDATTPSPASAAGDVQTPPAVAPTIASFEVMDSATNGPPPTSPIKILSGTFAFGLFQDSGHFIAAKAPGNVLLVIRPKAVILATGSTELLAPFANNDLPGIFAGRGLARLVTRDRLLPGRQVVVAGDGDERHAVAALLQEAGATIVAEVGVRPGPVGHLIRARGRARVAGAVIADAMGMQAKVRCDMIAVTDERSAFLDLARHAGAHVEWRSSGGFAVVVDPRGSTGVPGVYACGEITGPCGPAESASQGETAGRAAAEAALVAGGPA